MIRTHFGCYGIGLLIFYNFNWVSFCVCLAVAAILKQVAFKSYQLILSHFGNFTISCFMRYFSNGRTKTNRHGFLPFLEAGDNQWWERKTTVFIQSSMRIRWLPLAEDQLMEGVSFITAPTSLSVSDCTTLTQSFQTAASGWSCRGAVLDTDLSHVNKSQAHQAECCCWPAALLIWGLEGGCSRRFITCYPNTTRLPALELVMLIGSIKDQSIVSCRNVDLVPLT